MSQTVIDKALGRFDEHKRDCQDSHKQTRGDGKGFREQLEPGLNLKGRGRFRLRHRADEDNGQRFRLLTVNWFPEAGSEARVWGVASGGTNQKGRKEGGVNYSGALLGSLRGQEGDLLGRGARVLL